MYAQVKHYLRPWCKSLWYWEVEELRAHAAAHGVPTEGLEAEGLKEVARLLHNRPSLGHEEVWHFAEQVQNERHRKHGPRMWHMQLSK